jgi:uncharacterized damage-inducible protein DinB
MTLGWLAGFLGAIWTWGSAIVEEASFDPVVAQRQGPRPTPPTSRQEILDLFDKNTAKVRSAIAAASDDDLMKPWTLLADGKPVFTQPRWLLLRTYVLNHAIHHRAQLGIFLRLLDVPVPAVYNGSADEAGGMFIN